MDWWQPRVLGRTGLRVSRLGLGSSYGLAGKDVERAVERGVTYLYWGSRRRDDFGDGIRRCARRDRDRLCVVVQSYSRSALALGPSLEVALRRLGDYRRDKKDKHRDDDLREVSEHHRAEEDRHFRETEHIKRGDKEDDDEEPLHQHAEERA